MLYDRRQGELFENKISRVLVPHSIRKLLGRLHGRYFTKEGLVDIIKSIDLETDKIVAGIKKNRVLLEKSALQDAKARSKKKSR